MHERVPGVLDDIVTRPHLDEGRLTIQLGQLCRVLWVELDDAED